MLVLRVLLLCGLYCEACVFVCLVPWCGVCLCCLVNVAYVDCIVPFVVACCFVRVS